MGSFAMAILVYGKPMPNISGNQHVDSLPIFVPGYGISQLVKVSKFPDYTGDKKSLAVV